MFYLIALAVTALILGYVAGHLHYRFQLMRALKAGAVRHPAHVYDDTPALVEPPIDHDAMFRIIRQHQR